MDFATVIAIIIRLLIIRITKPKYLPASSFFFSSSGIGTSLFRIAFISSHILHILKKRMICNTAAIALIIVIIIDNVSILHIIFNG